MGAGQLVSNVWYVQDLVKRANEQDKAAFGELYERYWPRIYNYLCRQLDGRSQEAEDLTAEVFARVYETIGSYQFRGLPFSAWLFRMAHNQLIDHVRSRPRAPSAPLEDASEVQEPSSLRALRSPSVVARSGPIRKSPALRRSISPIRLFPAPRRRGMVRPHPPAQPQVSGSMAMAMAMTPTRSWLNHGLSTQVGAMVCAVLPVGLLAGALWEDSGPGAAAGLALAFLALAALLLRTVRWLAAT